MTEHSKPALDSNSPSIRNELLANISRQTTLTTQLFSILSQQPQSRASSSLPDVYAALQDASQEQAELIEKVRVHQHRWKRIEAKRRRLDELDGQVRTVLVGLHEAVNELEMMVDEGTKVIKSIDAAESASLTASEIISYAHLLAPYTSRGPTWPPTHVGAFGERFLYPRSDQMNQGRLREVVVGMIGGVGESGRVVEVDGRLEKVPQEHKELPFVQAPQQAKEIAPRHPVPPPVSTARVPFNLDLDSDSDSD